MTRKNLPFSKKNISFSKKNLHIYFSYVRKKIKKKQSGHIIYFFIIFKKQILYIEIDMQIYF